MPRRRVAENKIKMAARNLRGRNRFARVASRLGSSLLTLVTLRGARRASGHETNSQMPSHIISLVNAYFCKFAL